MVIDLGALVKNNSTLQPVLIMLLGAVVLQLVPVSGEWIFLKPNFLLLVMIAWILYFPEQYSIEFSVLIGIFSDLLFGSTLGYHVFVFAVCGLILMFLHRLIVYLQVVHRVILVFVLVLLVELLRVVVYALLGIPLFLETILPLAIISSLCWIPLDRIMNGFYSHQQ